MSYFLDLSNLSSKDIDEIKHIGKALSLDFQPAMHKWMDDNPGKVKVLGEMKNGKIIRDEIDENGVKEYREGEAIVRMIEEVVKRNRDRKKDKDNDK